VTVHVYHLRVGSNDTDPRYTATIDELPGCLAEGEGLAGAMASLGSVLADWVPACVESMGSIPGAPEKRCDGCHRDGNPLTCPDFGGLLGPDGYCSRWEAKP
jgi:predicted RNase H-like HicB family nuclease